MKEIFMFVLCWMFLQKYKKSEPKYQPELPYTNTEGLANVMHFKFTEVHFFSDI